MDFWIAVAPIIFLIAVMTKRKSWPSHIALPATALLVLVLRVLYFQSESWLTGAAFIKGALSALTPIAIIWSAILLAEFMQKTGAQAVVNETLNRVSRHPVAQLMLIGWAFTFMLEGASGFGTPAAIAAPILVAMGFPPLRVAMLTLVMNSVPVSFGAVGTPTWFGFGSLSLSQEALLAIGVQSAWIHAVASLVIPAFAVSLVLRWKEVRHNFLFILLSSLSCSLPYLGLAHLNYEFPSLVGGAVGILITALLAKLRVGLSSSTFDTVPRPPPEEPQSLGRRGRTCSPAVAFFPYLLLIAILILTRLPNLGLRGVLAKETPSLDVILGTMGEVSISASLVVSWSEMLGTPTHWEFPALFIPAFIPFLLVVLLMLPLFPSSPSHFRESLATATRRLQLPSLTLIGALIMVELMMESSGEKGAMTFIIGKSMAELTGTSWQYFASLMGALGSFFSGSASVSNLTFGSIQLAIANETGLDPTLLLALQSVGAAMGNMVCINNIVAVCTILGLANQEGKILKRTILPMIVYAFIAAAMSLILAAM